VVEELLGACGGALVKDRKKATPSGWKDPRNGKGPGGLAILPSMSQLHLRAGTRDGRGSKIRVTNGTPGGLAALRMGESGQTQGREVFYMLGVHVAPAGEH